jgi:hypothetical protein
MRSSRPSTERSSLMRRYEILESARINSLRQWTGGWLFKTSFVWPADDPLLCVLVAFAWVHIFRWADKVCEKHELEDDADDPRSTGGKVLPDSGNKRLVII